MTIGQVTNDRPLLRPSKRQQEQVESEWVWGTLTQKPHPVRVQEQGGGYSRFETERMKYSEQVPQKTQKGSLFSGAYQNYLWATDLNKRRGEITHSNKKEKLGRWSVLLWNRHKNSWLQTTKMETRKSDNKVLPSLCEEQ